MKFSEKQKREPSLTATGLAVGLALYYLAHGIGLIAGLAGLYLSIRWGSVLPLVAVLTLVYPYGKAMDKLLPRMLKRFEKPERESEPL